MHIDNHMINEKILERKNHLSQMKESKAKREGKKRKMEKVQTKYFEKILKKKHTSITTVSLSLSLFPPSLFPHFSSILPPFSSSLCIINVIYLLNYLENLKDMI